MPARRRRLAKGYVLANTHLHVCDCGELTQRLNGRCATYTPGQMCRQEWCLKCCKEDAIEK